MGDHRYIFAYWVREGLVAVQYPEEKGGGYPGAAGRARRIDGFADFIDDNGRRCQAFEAYAKLIIRSRWLAGLSAI